MTHGMSGDTTTNARECTALYGGKDAAHMGGMSTRYIASIRFRLLSTSREKVNYIRAEGSPNTREFATVFETEADADAALDIAREDTTHYHARRFRVEAI